MSIAIVQHCSFSGSFAITVLLGASSLTSFVAMAATELSSCANVNEDAARLACYDRAAGRQAPSAAEPALETKPAPLPSGNGSSTRSPLSERWELDDADKHGIFAMRAHLPTYLLPLHYTDSSNDRPVSPSFNSTGPVSRDYRHTEAKFQLSFKAKIAERLFDRADVWFGYTQQSLWQVYNKQQSAAFRETNYEPELMLVMPTDYSLVGLHGRLFSVGVAHQSNGQADPRSRSWNRVYAQVGLERDDFVLLLRPWWRIPENAATDDNPDIADYIGRGEIIALYRRGEQQWAIQLRNNFRASDNRGSVKLTWNYPLAGGLKGYIELFSGYGESLIDYNHRQNTIGFGISLIEWM
jgi:phospholipase A1